MPERAPLDLPEVTYRCRVFLLMENSQTGRKAYTEVWETEDSPVPLKDLPKGEPVIDVTGTSRVKLRHQVTEAECIRGIRNASYWHGGGV